MPQRPSKVAILETATISQSGYYAWYGRSIFSPQLVVDVFAKFSQPSMAGSKTSAKVVRRPIANVSVRNFLDPEITCNLNTVNVMEAA
jgi:hypothetical protein